MYGKELIFPQALEIRHMRTLQSEYYLETYIPTKLLSMLGGTTVNRKALPLDMNFTLKVGESK